MGLVISALVVNVVISLIIPVIILVTLWGRYPMERKGIGLLSLVGILSYAGMQWGIKEHGLAYLFNHTTFQNFMNVHYIPYLLIVAFAGAVFALLPVLPVAIVCCRRQLSFHKVTAWGLAYGATESVMLVGYKSLMTIVEYAKDTSQEISATAGELFLSGYERILIMIIEVAILMALVYFIEQKMTVRGICIQLICHTLVSFLPGFFIAFSTTSYYEVFDRSTTLIFVYIVLTVGAACAIALLNAMRYSMVDATVDSKEAIEDYNIRLQVRKDMKTEKKIAKKQKKEERSVKGGSQEDPAEAERGKNC